jgi:hypothetical protein
MPRPVKLVTRTFGIWTVTFLPNAIVPTEGLLKGLALVRKALDYSVNLLSGSIAATPSSQDGSASPSTDDKTCLPDTEPAGGITPPSSFLYLMRFMKEVFSLDPALFYLYIASNFASIVRTTLDLYASNRLLEATSQCLGSESCDLYNVAYALALRVSLAFLTEIISTSSWVSFCCFRFSSNNIFYSRNKSHSLEQKVTQHFRLKVLEGACARVF